MRKRNLTVTTALLLTTLFICSCTKKPSSCLTIDKGKTVKVNEEVQFDGSCSTNETSYE